MGVLATRAAAVPPHVPPSETGERGFSLAEVMVSMGILAVALLSLAGVFTTTLARASNASYDMVAKEQATQAIESIFAGRDSGRLTWVNLQNVANGGIFKDGAQALIDPGVDRISNTTDDDATKPTTLTKPGPNGNLGDADDIVSSLANFTREVRISAAPGNSGDTLREIRVIVEYNVSGFKRHFEMVSYISSYGS
jgi:prepilin-type N-terminal cleavage/methylation domain-containing protein